MKITTACVIEPVSPAPDRSRLDAILASYPAGSEEFAREIRLMLAAQFLHTADLVSKNRQLEMRNHEAERASRLKNEFVARVGHELRGSLQTIMGFAELLSLEIKGALNAEQQQFLSYIQRDSRHVLALINAVIDLGRIDAGQMELRLETLEGEPVILESLTALRPLAETREISLESSIAPGLLLRADRARFGEILSSLVGNAVKFAPDRGRIGVESRRLGGCALISIRNPGIGISPASSVMSSEPGLTITRRLIQLHGGRIWVESDAGPGSQVHFTIPLAAGSA